ncbi:MAG: hypothetical protein ACC642_02175 [Pseudomonadales bacterium]
MKKLILLTALLATSAFAEFEVKVNRIEASATDKVTPEAEIVQEVVDEKTIRLNTSTGDEAGTLKGQMKSRRLDVDSDGDGLAKHSR